MSASSWIQVILLAAILGVVGQMIRFGLGAAGPNTASVTARSFLVTFGTAVIVGAVAGVISSVATNLDPNNISSKAVLALIAAGYAGTDALDQFIAHTGISNGRKIG